VQAADIESQDNVFLKPFGVHEVARKILQMSNIVVPHELFLLAQPYSYPGTYTLPLALLDDNETQVNITVELTPRQSEQADVGAETV
jgi:hypothetical protein